MKELLLTLVSGLIGVILGSAFQFFFNYKAEKRRILHEYKVIIRAEMQGLLTKAGDLLSKPEEYNNTIFSVYLDERENLISYMIPLFKTEKKKNEVREIIEIINKRKDEFSLNPDFEKALLKGGDEKEKKKFLLRLGDLIGEVHKKVAAL